MRIPFLFLFLLIPLLLFPQENTTEENAAAEAEPGIETETVMEAAAASEAAGKEKSGLDPAYILDRDISTSSQAELADWCRSLGLSGEGSRESLAEQLRSYYKLEKPQLVTEGPPENSEGTLIITVENARTTEYFTVESVKEDYVRLRGGVSLTLKDNAILHRVKADEILYNRTRKLLTASGSVVYVKEEGDIVETFRGEGITVNLDTWSSAFMKGMTEHGLNNGETRYRFSGEVISRSGENSTVLRKAEITNANGEESYWSIKASKLWLLPGSDWAVFNAVIKVGEVPLLYLPALYYPGNEIIFHPVLGFRSREGTFVQTTTYLLGRPKAAAVTEENSIAAIMGSGDGMEKVREGIFLRTTGQKIKDPNEPRLSLMADAYVNLGYFLGSELVLPPKGSFGELLFSVGFGFSRDITLDSYGNYTPFPNYDGTSNWHSSKLFDFNVPFRYRFISTGSVSGSGNLIRSAALSWNFPFYSDPVIDNDYMRRFEDSSLFSLIKRATSPDSVVTDTFLDSYSWQLNGNLSFATTGIQPYVSELSINNASMAVNFGTKDTFPIPSADHPPNQKFFYPEKFTVFSVTASIRGTPLSFGVNNWDSIGEEADISGFGKPISPWKDRKEENAGSGQNQDITPPEFFRAVQNPVLEGHRFTLDYQLTPTASSEIRFNSNRVDPAVPSGPGHDLSWKRPEDIDWTDLEYQLYSIRADGSVGLNLSENRNIYSHSLRFFGTVSWQDYTYMNENSSAFDTTDKQDNAVNQTRNMTYFSNSAEYSFTLAPFYKNEIWQTSNFRYLIKGLIVSGRYYNDVWQVNGGKWDQKDIEYHRVQANLNANVMDHVQSLSITAEIPPKESALAGDATARVWISETNARARVRSIFEDPVYEPVYLTETLRFTEKMSLLHYMVYEPEKSAWTMIRTSFTWRSFNASFTAARSRGYTLISKDVDPNGFGWEQDQDERLNPQELNFGYQQSYSFNNKGRVSFEGSVNTGLTFDLQRHTYSKFFFTLGVGTKINKFLDVSLRSHSENAVIYRYFRNFPLFENRNIDVPGEKNLFVDLINSFRFDDVNKRMSSGFKLKSFSFDLVHHLGDWDATLGINITPELNTNVFPYKYRFINQISFLVKWKPISEFKTDFKYNTKDGISFDSTSLF